jgi:osmotically-inducible protein OsmY
LSDILLTGKSKMKTDDEMQRDILEELKWEPSVNAAHIGVSVKDGVVTLSGHVSSFSEKYSAQKAAKRVYGVKAVANELDVELPESSRRSDEDIATAAVYELKSNTWIPPDQIKVTVSNGWITLEGEVEWEYQKEAAENSVRYLAGVRGISNFIRVKPKIAPTDLKAKIEAAFKRAAAKDARKIKVEVQDDKVILRGIVYSMAEREGAERAAWSAPGISQVENQIVVAQPTPKWLRVASFILLVSIFLMAVPVTASQLRHWFASHADNDAAPPGGTERVSDPKILEPRLVAPADEATEHDR